MNLDAHIALLEELLDFHPARRPRIEQLIVDLKKLKSFSVIQDLQKLQAFFAEVAKLCSDHDIISNAQGDFASVKPSKLGDALERVDPEWYKHV